MKRYIVMYELDEPEEFEYIKDAAEAWCAYPSGFECCVIDKQRKDYVSTETLESILGYEKTVPAPIKPRPRQKIRTFI